MARLNLTVEGATEQVFVQRVLGPHLASFGVYLSKPRGTSLGKKRGRVHRGGMGRYLPLKKDLERWLKEERGPDTFFTTMIDLYGLARDFPGHRESERIGNPHQRVARLEKSFEDDIADPRFIAYLQLHEFESLLFCDPAVIGMYFAVARRRIDALSQVVAEVDCPELIDDGPETAPSKRIAREIPEYPRRKSSAGPEIAERIGLPVLRAKCPHFAQWLARLERLGASN